MYGGFGEDKVWGMNPGEMQHEGSYSYLHGGPGNDILYGAPQGKDEYGREYLFGDYRTTSYEGTYERTNDDIIYTGDSPEHSGPSYLGDKVYGGRGNDKLYGQGAAPHILYGNEGDDYMVGGSGDNVMHGDDYSAGPGWLFGAGRP